MSDFASAAMVAVMHAGLQRLGLGSDGPALPDAAAGAHVALQTKRALVGAALAQGGWAALPLLGQGFHGQHHAPLHRALASAPDVASLLARWSRLEKYVHSRHRVELLQLGGHEARLRHVSLRAGEPPMAAESLVVLGLLCALLQSLGLQQVQARAGAVPAFPLADGEALRALAEAGAAGSWHLSWQAPDSSADAGPAAAARAPALPLDLCQALPWPELAQRCARRLLQDLMHPPTVASLAQGLALSPRSLQRHLQQHGLRVSQLLAEVRLRAAAWWLLETQHPLAEAGFLSGYADQAHFNRCFKRHTGMAPGAYRQSFSG